MASKVFIVTGASKGIGAAIARYLLSQSHKVVVTARSSEPLEGLKKSHPDQVQFIAGDIVDPQLPTKLTDLAVSSFGKIDGLVINHGTLTPKRFADTTVEEWKQVYDVNVFSGVAMAQAALNELRKSKGCIVWVSSGAATKYYAAWSSYGSAKAAYNSISAHIALEEPDITSVAIAPGRVDTGMQDVLRSEGRDTMDKAQYETFAEAKDKGTLLRPEQPGHVMAKFVADPLRDLSGKFFTWNSPEVAAYQE
ncbi:corticosteroid 11-beta-dehydrogenase [Fusarium albosuccineum]|uniref:Corticosteroid 11-beta-dehydrogenase n=1 Tax=Fusarium albosuccineum TaxID=1237068 RepID=A0A8H4LP79_9HYPO|nr:corticosteroid 11-beta-dehydrogenase [Fusarium albosuccineum]